MTTLFRTAAEQAASHRLTINLAPKNLAVLNAILASRSVAVGRVVDAHRLAGLAGVSSSLGGVGMSLKANELLEDLATLGLDHAEVNQVLAD
jgi:hypothetical protein